MRGDGLRVATPFSFPADHCPMPSGESRCPRPPLRSDARRTGRHRPDLCLLLARQAQPRPLVAIASRALLAQRAEQLGLSIELRDAGPQDWPGEPAPANCLYVWDTARHCGDGRPARPAQCSLCTGDVDPRRTRLPGRQFRRHDHRPGAQGRDQRSRHSLLGTPNFSPS